MRAFVLVALLSCLSAAQAADTSSGKQSPMQLASPGLQFAGIDETKAKFYSAHLAQQLSLQPDVRCITAAEIGSLLGMERQRQLMGCDTAGESCLAELANALGVDGTVTGSVGLVGSTYQVNVRILSARDGSQLAAASASVKNEEALLPLLNEMAVQLSADLRRALGRQPVELSRESSGLRRWAWVPAVAGGLAAGTGAYFLYRAENASARLRADPTTNPEGRPSNEDEARALVREGQSQQTVARVAFAAAAVGVGTAAIFYLLGGESSPSASVAIVPGGAAVSIAVSW